MQVRSYQSMKDNFLYINVIYAFGEDSETNLTAIRLYKNAMYRSFCTFSGMSSVTFPGIQGKEDHGTIQLLI